MRLTILGTQNDMRQSFRFIVNLTGLYYQSAKLLPSGNRTSQWKISHLWKFYDVLNIKTSMNRGFPIVMFHYRTIYKDDSAYSLKMGQLLPPQPNGQLWAISHFCLQPLPCLLPTSYKLVCIFILSTIKPLKSSYKPTVLRFGGSTEVGILPSSHLVPIFDGQLIHIYIYMYIYIYVFMISLYNSCQF